MLETIAIVLIVLWLLGFEQFSTLIEKHWNGIGTYGKPLNKVKLGFCRRARITRSE